MKQRLSKAQIKEGIKSTPFTCSNCQMGVFENPREGLCRRCRINVRLGRGLNYWVYQDEGKF